MAFGRQTTAALVKPLEGAIVRRVTLGATTEAGELITLQSDGFWDPTLTTGAQLTVAVAVKGGVAGDRVDAVFYGPVTALIDGTPGTLIYGSDTAGEPLETVGTKDVIVGYVESATVLFVQPQLIDLS
jgi:hypothetical protein